MSDQPKSMQMLTEQVQARAPGVGFPLEDGEALLKYIRELQRLEGYYKGLYEDQKKGAAENAVRTKTAEFRVMNVEIAAATERARHEGLEDNFKQAMVLLRAMRGMLADPMIVADFIKKIDG